MGSSGIAMGQLFFHSGLRAVTQADALASACVPDQLVSSA